MDVKNNSHSNNSHFPDMDVYFNMRNRY